MTCPTHGKAYKAYCPDCASGLPRATFPYPNADEFGDVIKARPKPQPAIQDVYCVDTIRQVVVKLEPVLARIRKRGVDARVNRALNELKLALLEYEDGSRHGRN